MPEPAAACLTDDVVAALAGGASLGGLPAAEAHVATCATCSALVAAAIRGAAPRWDDLAGTTLGPYRLDAQLGAGGMGAVYRAWDPRLHRAIAVKVLGPAAGGARATEARAAAAVAHPNVVAIYDVGTAGELTYVAMELVEGESLRSVIARGPVPPARARALAIELADGLAAAHARGVVHRDLKPENLVVGGDGRLRILDFGLAVRPELAALDATEPGDPARPERGPSGTAGYMAPEQARGEAVDARADLFAAGAILYELVTGERAFAGGSFADRLTAVLRDAPPSDRLGPLAPIVERCLAKDPAERFQSARDLAWALRRVELAPVVGPAASPARSGAPRRAIVVGAGAAALAGAAGFVLGRRRARAPAVAHPVFHQLTYRTGRVYTARFVAGGGRVVYGAAWDGEPVRVFQLELAGGGPRPLELGSADVLAAGRHGELAVSLGRRFTEHQSATGQLAIVPADGGAPRLLASGVEDADLAPAGQVAAIVRVAGRSRLELPLGTPLTEGAWLTHPRVSPDGAHVAYLEHPHVNDDAGALRVVEVATRRVRTLAGGWASIAGVAWAPRGREVWFTAAREGADAELHVAGWDGAVRTVAQTTGRLRLHDLAADGRAAITVDDWRLRTLVAAPGAAARDVSMSWVSYAADLSTDGATVVLAEADERRGELATYLAPVGGGKPLRLGPGFPLAVSPSGAWVAAARTAAPGAADRIVALATASAIERVFPAPAGVRSARWLDDERLVAAAAGRLWRLAADTDPVALTGDLGAGLVVVDPARRRVAFVTAAGALHRVDLATGEVTRVPGELPDQVACGWIAEPDTVLVRTRTTPVAVTRVDPTSGAATPHLTIEPPPVGLKAVDAVVFDATGQRYAYSFGQELSHLYLLAFAS